MSTKSGHLLDLYKGQFEIVIIIIFFSPAFAGKYGITLLKGHFSSPTKSILICFTFIWLPQIAVKCFEHETTCERHADNPGRLVF